MFDAGDLPLQTSGEPLQFPPRHYMIVVGHHARQRDSGFDLGFEFKAMHAVWDEPARFTALAVGAAPQVMRRLNQIRMLKPR